MGARLRSWWQQTRKPLVVSGCIAALVVVALIFLEVIFYGTGFAGKTLWDWLNLLGVLAIPVVVGLGAVWFTTRQGKVADAENKDNQREAAFLRHGSNERDSSSPPARSSPVMLSTAVLARPEIDAAAMNALEGTVSNVYSLIQAHRAMEARDLRERAEQKGSKQ